MFQLENDQLVVAILDPLTDQDRFGVRYCTGGYIFQITDRQRGELLAGPTFPDSFNWFDGQGIPDAFNNQPLRTPGGTDAEVEIIGIGRCNLPDRSVLVFCVWEVQVRTTSVSLQTRQAFGAHALMLERQVSLLGRTVRSHTRLHNQGSSFIPLCWFPHPFYPQPETDELCRLNIPFALPENEGYCLAASGYIRRKKWPEQRGFYQALEQQAQQPLTIMQRHPLLGLVSASCSYVPDFFPIWGNQHTFSWEPFFERLIAPGQAVSWWIDYDF
ncbi:MAG: hypothetical protein KDI44_12660 [Thiothrix sp.]|nr:hypothetical protein [Thiothrix sp.]